MLNGESTLPFAEKLHDSGIPFVFATGYADAVDQFRRFSGVPIVEKPYCSEQLIDAIIAATTAASA
jgi:FixJ family two-component response regulator